MTVQRRAKSVAVIGGGASGAVAVDVLVKEQSFDKIKAFERRESVGGVWHLDEKIDEIPVRPGSHDIHNDPQQEIPEGLIVDGDKLIKPRLSKERFIYTPSYEHIRTNVPEFFMTFSDKPKWPKLDKPEVDPFTLRKYVDEYIHDYWTPNLKYLQLRTTLERVDQIEDDDAGNHHFELTFRQETDIKNDEGEFIDYWWKESFDAIVLANGHYHVPHIPNVLGLDELISKYPDVVKYAKQFRNDTFYKDKSVVVVGGSASGIDISNVLLKLGAKNVYRSENLDKPRIKVRPTSKGVQLRPIISKYELINDEIVIHFEDGSTLSNPDHIIYGTGYDYSYPFLRHLYPQFSDKGVYLPDNFQHTFHIPDPKISSIGVPVGALSFRGFEYQSILVSRYLSGKISLPSKESQYDWVKDRQENLGINRSYHRIGNENVVNYLKALTDLGGGVDRIGEHGREFPIITQDQVDDWNAKRALLIGKHEEDSPGVLQTFEAIN